jgi:RNA-directed DNA polymerase
MIQSISHLEGVTGYTQEEMTAILADPPDYYYHFAQLKGIEKGSRQFRHYNPSRGRLRDLQNRLHTRIFSAIPLPPHVQGCVAGRRNITNARAHQGKTYKFHTDLRSYFDFVSNKQIYDAFRRLSFSPTISRLLTQLTTFKGHLPQGPPTSPFLANLAALPMDQALLTLVTSHGITYTRYVDDLCFSAQRDFQFVVPAILAIVEQHGFFYGHKKTYYKKGPLEITGATVGNNHLMPTAKQWQKYFAPETEEPTRRGMRAYFTGLDRA